MRGAGDVHGVPVLPVRLDPRERPGSAVEGHGWGVALPDLIRDQRAGDSRHGAHGVHAHGEHLAGLAVLPEFVACLHTWRIPFWKAAVPAHGAPLQMSVDAGSARTSTAHAAFHEGDAAAVAARLVQWFAVAGRELPWRRTRDPYAIWVSEVMLQQTQVATVIPYYERWLDRFPDVATLAEAAEEEVLALWAGLGYYSRARALWRAARHVRETRGGRLPGTARGWAELPGVGPYTAGAVASLAYGEPVPAVDGNAERVLCRLLALRGDPRRAPAAGSIRAAAEALLAHAPPAALNQALMELGATLCAPRSPRCGACPVRQACRAAGLGLQEELPERSTRPEPVARRMAVAVALCSGCVYLTRSSGPWWRGLWVLPTSDLGEGEEPAAGAERLARGLLPGLACAGEPLPEVRHAVTRYRIRLFPYRFHAPESALDGDGHWRPLAAALGETPLPSPHRRVLSDLARG